MQPYLSGWLLKAPRISTPCCAYGLAKLSDNIQESHLVIEMV